MFRLPLIFYPLFSVRMALIGNRALMQNFANWALDRGSSATATPVNSAGKYFRAALTWLAISAPTPANSLTNVSTASVRSPFRLICSDTSGTYTTRNDHLDVRCAIGVSGSRQTSIVTWRSTRRRAGTRPVLRTLSARTLTLMTSGHSWARWHALQARGRHLLPPRTPRTAPPSSPYPHSRRRTRFRLRRRCGRSHSTSVHPRGRRCKPRPRAPSNQAGVPLRTVTSLYSALRVIHTYCNWFIKCNYYKHISFL